jgi:lipopolysaccharide biosynthesis regulator YciM
LCNIFAQLSDACTTTADKLSNIEQRLSQLNSHDPEVITLHYLFLQDCIKELNNIKSDKDDLLFYCQNKKNLQKKAIDLLAHADSLNEIFAEQVKIVDELFYQKAKIEYIFADNDKTEYYLNRALQFNKHNVDALLLKVKLKFEEKDYQDCLTLFKELFNHNELSEQQENEIYQLSSAYYYEVYNLGDSLVKADKGAYAIDLFQLLETFCHEIPSTYCNDDYYHGIMRSKQGVYDSYIAIARAARERKNYELEKKFLRYAEEYLKENGMEN